MVLEEKLKEVIIALNEKIEKNLQFLTKNQNNTKMINFQDLKNQKMMV